MFRSDKIQQSASVRLTAQLCYTAGMKIVVTNWSGLTTAHVAQLEKLGDVVLFTDTNNDNYAERLADADVAVIDCFLTPVTKEFLASVPHLKYFTINSTGYDNVDVEAVRAADVVASHVPAFSTDSVAELAIGLMFAAVRKIPAGNEAVQGGFYETDPGTPEMETFQGFNLSGKTLGVVGLGNIGTRVAEIGKGIGMRVIAHNRTLKDVPDVTLVSLEELMCEADVVILSVAVAKETEGLITKELIETMKQTAVLVNIARMALVDQEALKTALNNGAIAGAGLDVTNEEMRGVKNVVCTPHIGYNTRESIENMADIIVENIKAYVAGAPVHKI